MDYTTLSLPASWELVPERVGMTSLYEALQKQIGSGTRHRRDPNSDGGNQVKPSVALEQPPQAGQAGLGEGLLHINFWNRYCRQESDSFVFGRLTNETNSLVFTTEPRSSRSFLSDFTENLCILCVSVVCFYALLVNRLFLVFFGNKGQLV